MKKALFSLLILHFTYAGAQNLLSNPGFEFYSALPANYGEFFLATDWGNCNGQGTPDYFHTGGTVGTYFGTNLPHTGDAMGGFCPYHGASVFREYYSAPLSTPMVAGLTYSVSFWLASGINGGYGYGCNNVGVNFSIGPITQVGTDPILLNPQIEITTIIYDTAWTQFSFQYTASSAFDYFTIGNFRDDGSTQSAQFGIPYDAVYYFVDDIVVELSNQPPVAIFNAPNHICPGTCTDFTNLSLNATSFLWSFPGATPSVSTDVNPLNICYNTPGTYNVSLIATNAITSDTLSLTNYMTVYPYPAPQGISQNGDTLTANTGAISYQWYLNGSLIPGATDYFYIALQSGDYNVVCTDENGCEVEAVIFSVLAGTQQASGSNSMELVLFPNPAGNTLSVKSYTLQETAPQGVLRTVKISIYNLLGALAAQPQTSNLKPGTIVDVSNLPSGMYWLELTYDETIFRKEFVKK